MTIEKVLYCAHAHVTGGRDGRATDPESNQRKQFPAWGDASCTTASPTRQLLTSKSR
jgi:hypothetical protein